MNEMSHGAALEITSGRRFAFGRNWARFLLSLDESQIRCAEDTLRAMLEVESLAGYSFLDVGSGSGLFSLAARRLGATVCSFDFDPESVACARELKARYLLDDPDWKIEQGSALDREYLASLGTFDIVYSWGVLHHTGAMWPALEIVARAVKRDGVLFIALYNDQGWISRYWHAIKRCYVVSPGFVRALMILFFSGYFAVGLFVADLLRLRNPLRRYTGEARGMKFITDVVDWVGGYPFEVATPGKVVAYLSERGFSLTRQHRVGRRHGCNEFVFTRSGYESFDHQG